MAAAIWNYLTGGAKDKDKNKGEDKDGVPSVSFPFRNLLDEKGRRLNIILLTAPFREPEHRRLFAEYRRRGMGMCGMSSYMEFPIPVRNPHDTGFATSGSPTGRPEDDDYVGMVDAWLHCFRPEMVAEARLDRRPHLLLTEADLADVGLREGAEFCGARKDRDPSACKYDFIYVCLQDNDQCTPGWQSHNRNWELALRCLPILCGSPSGSGGFGLRGLIVGRENCSELKLLDEDVRSRISHLKFLPYWEFQDHLQKSKFLFVPNVSDASPRVITEAMGYDVRVLVNRHIVGGWHNVVSGVTGEMFEDERDLPRVLGRLLDPDRYAAYRPRRWFAENRGKERSGRILASFLRAHFKNLNRPDVQIASLQ